MPKLGAIRFGCQLFGEVARQDRFSVPTRSLLQQPATAPLMADVTEKSSTSSRLLGLLWFVAFEIVAFFALQFLASGLGERSQNQEGNTIVSNWVKTMAFIVAHLLLVLAAMLVLSNRLPRRYRRQLMGWFYLALGMTFVLLIPLFA